MSHLPHLLINISFILIYKGRNLNAPKLKYHFISRFSIELSIKNVSLRTTPSIEGASLGQP